jgi:hypothetical protein
MEVSDRAETAACYQYQRGSGPGSDCDNRRRWRGYVSASTQTGASRVDAICSESKRCIREVLGRGRVSMGFALGERLEREKR